MELQLTRRDIANTDLVFKYRDAVNNAIIDQDALKPKVDEIIATELAWRDVEIARLRQCTGVPNQWARDKAAEAVEALQDVVGNAASRNRIRQVKDILQEIVKSANHMPKYTEMGDVDKLVQRFLNWELPASVCSDGCVGVQGYPGRSGTNLLTADEAKQMLEHVLGVKIDIQAVMNISEDLYDDGGVAPDPIPVKVYHVEEAGKLGGLRAYIQMPKINDIKVEMTCDHGTGEWFNPIKRVELKEDGSLTFVVEHDKKHPSDKLTDLLTKVCDDGRHPGFYKDEINHCYKCTRCGMSVSEAMFTGHMAEIAAAEAEGDLANQEHNSDVLAADGKTPMYRFPGYPLMVSAAAFNILFAERSKAPRTWPKAGQFELFCQPDHMVDEPWRMTDGVMTACGRTPNIAINRYMVMLAKQHDQQTLSQDEVNAGVALHGLKVNGPNQLADAFRAGTAWALLRLQRYQQVDRTEVPKLPFIDVVLNGPPGPESDFVEVHDNKGRSISAGDWHDNGDGTWSLRIYGTPPTDTALEGEKVEDHFHRLTPAQAERLYLLAEESSEVIQAVAKILRHGYSSRHPSAMEVNDNRDHLTKELGDLGAAIMFLANNHDVDEDRVSSNSMLKLHGYEQGNWLHHNGPHQDK